MCVNRLQDEYKLEEIKPEECDAWVKKTYGKVLLSTGCTRDGVRSCLGFKWSEFDPALITSDQEFRFWLLGAVKSFYAATPTISAVRRGVACTSVLSNISLSNVSLSYEKVMALELGRTDDAHWFPYRQVRVP
mmetsp:Transcript_28084/g.56624  ORF Transcript_28084/g.56624 Transcript_28084/m.56624 type:complete len:133 (-) Transcript_28084:664-1062(-)